MVSRRKPRTYKPQMIIKGIHTSVDRSELKSLIIGQNPALNLATDADINIRVIKKNRNANLYNAIIEVTASVRRTLLEVGRVNIDCQRVHVSDISRFTQCYKCLQPGHMQSRCTSTIEPCSHCASVDHKYADCPDKSDADKLRCYNCHQNNIRTNGSVDARHSATSIKLCPRIKAVVALINSRTDYGC